MQPTRHNRFILALGSNATADIGANASILSDALERIKARGLTALRVSRYWRTPAWPPGAGPDFVNACALVEGEASVEAVLDTLHAIETAMGRVRTTRWAQRRIDLDLLAAGDLIRPDRATLARWMALPPEAQARETPDTLLLPHPRLHQRAFVLVPMAEVAPDWVHPVLGASVSQMLAALDPAETAGIIPL